MTVELGFDCKILILEHVGYTDSCVAGRYVHFLGRLQAVTKVHSPDEPEILSAHVLYVPADDKSPSVTYSRVRRSCNKR